MITASMSLRARISLVIARGEKIVAPDFFAVLKPAVVAIGDGDELHAGNLDGGAGIALALAAGADERDLDVVVGRRRRRDASDCAATRA